MSAGHTLSEAASKELLVPYGLPVPGERVVHDPISAVDAAEDVGFPVVAKLVGDAIAHKTERGLVRLHLADGPSVERAATELLAAARPEDGQVGVLIAPMIQGNRELIAGLLRDPQFGATVMLGVGGVLAEAVADVVSVDVNPLIVTPDGVPVAVDALVELGLPGPAQPPMRPRPPDDRFRALFEPRGVLITGASTHPGKFGF
ncbi:MAG: acetate--CoA ligase family protein, partial [Acidimicrobiia bacterium]